MISNEIESIRISHGQKFRIGLCFILLFFRKGLNNYVTIYLVFNDMNPDFVSNVASRRRITVYLYIDWPIPSRKAYTALLMQFFGLNIIDLNLYRKRDFSFKVILVLNRKS